MHTWWLFLAAVFLLCGTPGPNMLHVLVRSIQLGVRKSVMAMLGCLTGLVTVLSASAAGLSTIMLASPALFEGFRYFGVAYLVYLGVKSWRGSDAPFTMESRGKAGPMSARRVFLGGLMIGISNPKLVLFVAAFLPQFIDLSRPQLPQYAILTLTFAAVEVFWYVIYGVGGSKLAGCLTKSSIQKAFNRVTGCIFIAFGLTLLRVKQ